MASADFARLEYVSRAYEQVWGESRERLVANPMAWMEKVHPMDLDAVRQFCEKAKAGVTDTESFPEFRIFRESGEIRWIHARMFSIQRSGKIGDLKAFIAQDVTRSRCYEAALRESEEKWRSLTENAADQVLITDLDGHINYANRPFMGLSEDQLVGRHLLGMIPPAFDDSVRACFKRVVLEEESQTCRIEQAGPGADRFHFELCMSPVLVKRQIVAVAFRFIDITRRVRRERKLRESEAFHRTLFDQSPTGISIQDFSAIEAPIKRLIDSGVSDLRNYLMDHPDIVTDLARRVRIVRVNQAAADLYGAQSVHHMRGPLGIFLEKGDYRYFVEQVAAFSSGVDHYEGEARNRDFEGNTLHLFIRKVVINRLEKGLSKVMVSLIDVTPIKAAEKERSTLLLQLQQAQKMEAIGTLAGGVAHDFNNILSIILGNAELCRADPGSDQAVRQHIDKICTASLRARKVVQQLLGFSRKNEHVFKALHLLPLVNEALIFMRATLPASIAIDSNLSAADDVIRADATQIHQVLINLLTNAGHAMQDDSGSITVAAENVSLKQPLAESILSVPAGDFIRVDIIDTGSGIPESEQGKVFDPYYTTKAPDKGTGMGLSVVHGIIQRCGGGIDLTSRPGQGSRFSLYFPLADETADEAIPDKGIPSSGCERILFVDDEPMIVEICEQILTRLGYQVNTCADPQEALSMISAAQGRIDLLVTDMSMPGMNGEELIMRARHIQPALPVILCTGDNTRIRDRSWSDQGVTEILGKPLGMKALAEAVRRALDRRETGPVNGAG